MKNQEMKKFGRRFSSDDWQRLCSYARFLAALEKSQAEAEAVAWDIMQPTEANWKPR